MQRSSTSMWKSKHRHRWKKVQPLVMFPPSSSNDTGMNRIYRTSSGRNTSRALTSRPQPSHSPDRPDEANKVGFLDVTAGIPAISAQAPMISYPAQARIGDQLKIVSICQETDQLCHTSQPTKSAYGVCALSKRTAPDHTTSSSNVIASPYQRPTSPSSFLKSGVPRPVT